MHVRLSKDSEDKLRAYCHIHRKKVNAVMAQLISKLLVDDEVLAMIKLQRGTLEITPNKNKVPVVKPPVKPKEIGFNPAPVVDEPFELDIDPEWAKIQIERGEIE